MITISENWTNDERLILIGEIIRGKSFLEWKERYLINHLVHDTAKNLENNRYSFRDYVLPKPI